MNQSSTRTLSKSYFVLPKNDVIGLVLAAANVFSQACNEKGSDIGVIT